MKSVQLKLRPPFDAALSLQFWQRAAREQVDIVDGLTYRRLFFPFGEPLLLQIALDQNVENPSANLTLHGGSGGREVGWAMETARWLLNDDAPLIDFYRKVQDDRPLRELTVQLRGLRPLLSPSVFDTMLFAIVGQQVNVNFAYQCKSAMEERYARKAEINGRLWTAGLEPGDFSGVTVEDLRELKISNSKAKTILGLAEAFQRMDLDRKMLEPLSSKEIEDSLTNLWGIGPWTARYTLVRALGENDVLPIGDAGLRNAIHDLYQTPAKPDAEQIEQRAEGWKPYRSLATYYLWHRKIAAERALGD